MFGTDGKRGLVYHKQIEESGQPSLPVADASESNAIPQFLAAPSPAAPALAPDGTYILVSSMHIVKNGALIGLHPGTVVQALHDNGKTLHVLWENAEFDIDKGIVTNDLNVAQAAVANDQRGQAAVGSWIAGNYQKAEAQKKAQAQQFAADEKARIADEKARITEEKARADRIKAESINREWEEMRAKALRIPQASSGNDVMPPHSGSSISSAESARQTRQYLERQSANSAQREAIQPRIDELERRNIERLNSGTHGQGEVQDNSELQRLYREQTNLRPP